MRRPVTTRSSTSARWRLRIGLWGLVAVNLGAAWQIFAPAADGRLVALGGLLLALAVAVGVE